MIRGQNYEKKGSFYYLCVNFMKENGEKLSETAFRGMLDALSDGESPGREGWCRWLTALDEGQDARLRARAAEVSRRHFGHGVYIRGLIEISSYCRNFQPFRFALPAFAGRGVGLLPRGCPGGVFHVRVAGRGGRGAG